MVSTVDKLMSTACFGPMQRSVRSVGRNGSFRVVARLRRRWDLEWLLCRSAHSWGQFLSVRPMFGMTPCCDLLTSAPLPDICGAPAGIRGLWRVALRPDVDGARPSALMHPGQRGGALTPVEITRT